MMHACASGGKAPGRRVHSGSRRKGHVFRRITATSDVVGSPPGCQTVNCVGVAEAARSSAGRTQLDALRHLAGGRQPPQCDEQLARQRDDHGFARGAAAISGALAEPPDEPAVLLEDQKAPSQLDHAAANTAVAGAGQSLLAPALTAFVRRAGQPGIARDSSAIAQIARQASFTSMSAVSMQTPKTLAL